MATKIRLKRIGRRNRPFYRLVVMDSRKRRDGAAIEELGWYDPLVSKENSYKIKIERIIHWLSEGAIPTDATKKILRSSGVLHRWHLMSQDMDETAIEKEMKKWELNKQEILKSRRDLSEEKKIKKVQKDLKISEGADISQATSKKEAPAEESETTEETAVEESEATEEAPVEESETTEETAVEEIETEEEAPAEESETTEEAPEEESEAKEEAPEEESEAKEEAPEEDLEKKNNKN